MRNPNCSIKCFGIGKIAQESGVGRVKGSGDNGEEEWIGIGNSGKSGELCA